jgi:flagellar hook-length control protein FliK
MDSIPAAAALPIVVATDGQPAHDPITGEAGDKGTFEQALEKEISLISPDAAQAPADPALAALAALASSDPGGRADSTQILELILDSSGMLASGAAAAAAPAAIVDAVEPRADVSVDAVSEPGFKSARPVRVSEHIRGEAALGVPAQMPASTPALTDARAVQPQPASVDANANKTAELSAMVVDAQPQRSGPAPTPAQPQAAAPATSASVGSPEIPLEAMQAIASAARAPAETPEMLASTQKTLTPSAAPERSGVDSSGSMKSGEPSKTRSVSDDFLVVRSELRADRIAPEAGALSVNAAPPPPVDFAPRQAIAPLDALSSATLMQTWTPAPHQAANAASASPAVVRVDTPLAAPGWGDSFRQQVVWLVDRHLETAELHVNPPHLGPVEVVLKMADDGARIAFVSPHAAVREAIEASLADLRTSLAERGLALGEALVSADPGSAREQMTRDENVRGAPRNPDVAQGDPERETRVLPQQPRGLIDTFV